MSPPGHPAARGLAKGAGALPDLKSEPKRHIPKGRDGQEKGYDDDRDQQYDSSAWKQAGMGAENAGNGSRRPDNGCHAGWIGQHVGVSGKKGAERVEQEKPSGAHAGFDGPAEQPKRPHVEN